ncbi:MAG: hypothetical protein HRT58_22185 [Crocinitomicaceae bacterium]|nr:hypothetical protein [Flavobacteriales bacterium]NQZ38386.1 hypothetical protein [Crocinitomicaceae bacterium]
MIPFRLLLPGFTWVLLMALIFYTPISDRSLVYFGCVPARSFVHLFMFMVFTHLWLGIGKKQLKFETIRERAFPIVFAAAILLAVLSEVSLYAFGYLPWFNGWNLLLDLIGATLGMGTFYLLYRSCY